jgi:hypothetical protein
MKNLWLIISINLLVFLVIFMLGWNDYQKLMETVEPECPSAGYLMGCMTKEDAIVTVVTKHIISDWWMFVLINLFFWLLNKKEGKNARNEKS